SASRGAKQSVQIAVVVADDPTAHENLRVVQRRNSHCSGNEWQMRFEVAIEREWNPKNRLEADRRRYRDARDRRFWSLPRRSGRGCCRKPPAGPPRAAECPG